MSDDPHHEYPAWRLRRWRRLAHARRIPDAALSRWLRSAPEDLERVEDLPPLPAELVGEPTPSEKVVFPLGDLDAEDLERRAREPYREPVIAPGSEDPIRSALAQLAIWEATDETAAQWAPADAVARLADEAAAPAGVVSWAVAHAAGRVLADHAVRPDGVRLEVDPVETERLASATARHLRAFALSVIGPGRWLGVVPPRPIFHGGEPGPGHKRRSDADREAWGAHGAAVARAAELAVVPAEVNGHTLTALSAELGRYLKGLGGPAVEVAARWVVTDAARYDKATAPVLAEDWPRPSVLAGWSGERPYGGLVSFFPGGRALVALALAVWRAEVRPELERGRRHVLALPGSAGQIALAFATSRAPLPALQPGARHPVEIAPGRTVHLDLTSPALPVDLVEQLARGPAAVLGGVAGLRVLDLVLRTFHARIARGDLPWDAAPKVEIPKGRKLAELLELGDGGRPAREVDRAVLAWAALSLTDGRGDLVKLWHAPEARSHAPGRPAAWIVTAGEVLRPSFTAQQPEGDPWRRLVPWPDVLPPDSYADPSKRAEALRLGPLLAHQWREAAGRRRGDAWQDAPGVRLTDELWREVAPHLDRDQALEALAAAGWAHEDRGLLVPGAALPELTRALNDAASHARSRNRPKRARRK